MHPTQRNRRWTRSITSRALRPRQLTDSDFDRRLDRRLETDRSSDKRGREHDGAADREVSLGFGDLASHRPLTVPRVRVQPRTCGLTPSSNDLEITVGQANVQKRIVRARIDHVVEFGRTAGHSEVVEATASQTAASTSGGTFRPDSPRQVVRVVG